MSDVMEEFNRIKNNVIYLDWQILNYMFSVDSLEGELKNKTLCLLQLVMNNLNWENIVFPYSNAHLLDIRQGNKEFTEEKIRILSTVSRNWKISIDINSSLIRLDKYVDIKSDYLNYIEELEKSERISKQTMLSLSGIYMPTVDAARKSAKLITNYELRNKVLRLLSMIENQGKNDTNMELEILRFNRYLRDPRRRKILNNIKYPSIKKKIDEIKEEDIKKEVDEVLKSSGLPYNNHKDFFNTIINVPFLGEMQNKYLKLSGLSDFIGLTKEKLKKNTSFQSQINDLFHMLYGLNSHIFVTEDKNLYIKSKFIKKWERTNGKVYNIDEFIEHILYEVQRNRTISQDAKEIVYNFMDAKGNLIRSYKLTMN